MSGIGKDFFSSLKALKAKWRHERILQARIITAEGSQMLIEQKLTEEQLHQILNVLELVVKKEDERTDGT